MKKITSRAGAAQPKRNPERTRKQILDAATHEFAANGFEGARVDEIASRSGVNKNMIYHYFGSKDGLFTATLERLYETIRKRQRDLEVDALDPVDGIGALVKFTVDVFNDHPEYVRILNSENLADGEHIKRSEKIIAMYNPLLASIRQLLKRGTAAGLFRPGISAMDLYISIAALVSYYISNRATLSAIFGVDVNSPSRRRHRSKQITEMVLAYLQSGTPGRRRKSRKRSGRATILTS